MKISRLFLGICVLSMQLAYNCYSMQSNELNNNEIISKAKDAPLSVPNNKVATGISTVASLLSLLLGAEVGMAGGVTAYEVIKKFDGFRLSSEQFYKKYPRNGPFIPSLGMGMCGAAIASIATMCFLPSIYNKVFNTVSAWTTQANND